MHDLCSLDTPLLLRDLSPELFKLILDIECENILPILAAAGVASNRAEMELQLKKAMDQFILLALDNKKLAGYLIYKNNDRDIFITSICLGRKLNGPTHFQLAQSFSKVLENALAGNVFSSTHRINKRSINLHRRMGFMQTGEDSTKLKFEITCAQLLANLGDRVQVSSSTRKA